MGDFELEFQWSRAHVSHTGSAPSRGTGHHTSIAARLFPVRGGGGRSDAIMLASQNRESAGSMVSSMAKALARRTALPLRYSAATCSSK